MQKIMFFGQNRPKGYVHDKTLPLTLRRVNDVDREGHGGRENLVADEDAWSNRNCPPQWVKDLRWEELYDERHGERKKGSQRVKWKGRVLYLPSPRVRIPRRRKIQYTLNELKSLRQAFLQAKIPKHFQNYGDDDSENFRRPKLAEGVEAMSESDKEVEMELYRRRQVHYFYLGYTSSRNKPHFQAMGKHNLVLRNQLYDTAAQPWEGDNTSLQAQLIKTLEHWPEIRTAGEASPIQYSEEGWVPKDEFENAKERAEAIKNEMAQAADSEEERREFEELWPFQNHEETD
ncbi:hypothetical protein V493_01582 [Pseudogymnoascus sp. VKM F-4281 (FW-2241)]|nr:hypothetical protein V493_01582 [Pseudogymnoascus sp. VKM F-4281 (FW-2241)]